MGVTSYVSFVLEGEQDRHSRFLNLLCVAEFGDDAGPIQGVWGPKEEEGIPLGNFRLPETLEVRSERRVVVEQESVN